MRPFLFAFTLGCLVAWSGRTDAAEINSQELQAAIEQTAERYTKAFKERNVQALASLFTTEAEYVDSDGIVFHGRDAIAAEYQALFDVAPPGEISLEILSIRPVAAGIVIEDGISNFRSPDGEQSLQARYTATHAKQADGQWLLVSVRELESPSVPPRQRLKALSWLEGSWREEVGGLTVSTEWKWSEDGNFLISEFTIQRPEGISLKGTQRVGWDAERQQFRSWFFDSTGGSAEGWWTGNDDGSWSVQLAGVDAAGKRHSSILTYFPDGGDGLVITQDQRNREGRNLPSITQRIVKTPPAAGVRKTP